MILLLRRPLGPVRLSTVLLVSGQHLLSSRCVTHCLTRLNWNTLGNWLPAHTGSSFWNIIRYPHLPFAMLIFSGTVDKYDLLPLRNSSQCPQFHISVLCSLPPDTVPTLITVPTGLRVNANPLTCLFHYTMNFLRLRITLFSLLQT